MSNKLSTVPVLLSPAKQPTVAMGTHQQALTMFDHEAVKRRIRKAGMDVLTVAALSNETGMKYTLLGGPVVTVYNNGNHQVQGKVSERDRKRLQRALRSR